MRPTAHLDLSRRERQNSWRRSTAWGSHRGGRDGRDAGSSELLGRAAIIGKLKAKGYLEHRQEGPRYLYLAIVPRQEARESALERLVRTFFDGSTEKAVTALLGMSSGEMSDEELTASPL